MTSPFDGEKYEKLLEGLEASERQFSELLVSEGNLRFDSEYFLKAHIKDQSRVKANGSRFQTFADLGLTVDASAFYPAIEAYYNTGGLPFLRVADVDAIIDFEQCTTIPESLCTNFPTLNRVQNGDIVLTKGGSVARVGLVMKDAAVSRDLIFIDSSKLSEDAGVFLYLYFQTNFCNRLLVRSSSQTAQPHLTITLVRNLPLFKGSDYFRDKCLRAVQASFAARKESLKLYTQAERTLLSELGLLQWQPPEPLTYERKSSEAFATGRLDSEYFSPKYDSLEAFLNHRFTVERVGQWGKVLKGSSVEYTDEIKGVPVIRSGDLTDIEDDQKFLRALPDQDMFILKPNDVLVSSIGFGSIGKVQIFDKQGKYATVSEVTVIRQKRVNPYFLHFYLRSLAGQMQINRYITGATGQLHLYPKDVGVILVPLVSQELEQKLEGLFKTARRLKAEAKQLLETAKRAVEIAIEESETVAMAFLDANSLKE